MPEIWTTDGSTGGAAAGKEFPFPEYGEKQLKPEKTVLEIRQIRNACRQRKSVFPAGGNGENIHLPDRAAVYKEAFFCHNIRKIISQRISCIRTRQL